MWTSRATASDPADTDRVKSPGTRVQRPATGTRIASAAAEAWGLSSRMPRAAEFITSTRESSTPPLPATSTTRTRSANAALLAAVDWWNSPAMWTPNPRSCTA
ncbi:hypothetical protein [Amycolatopsis sp. PS_44_ISF1]|uniref:hypothetical protein n=1 Tax=Amycolatopsis sp. PS_44_ISF1 TaxID=2974917 RepID=UPI0028DE6BC3|nr:hypothetical protein [Amycolatopsis sp. PS_44_ISF1]MDT8913194.1 hypothetical protein [Amycolatopsis sp. PS_44_ISF1]